MSDRWGIWLTTQPGSEPASALWWGLDGKPMVYSCEMALALSEAASKVDDRWCYAVKELPPAPPIPTHLDADGKPVDQSTAVNLKKAELLDVMAHDLRELADTSAQELEQRARELREGEA